MADTERIKRNLHKMIAAQAPETDLDAYLATEGFKSAEDWRAAASQAPLSLSDVPGKALQNLPESAGNFVEAVAQPFLHPLDTARSVGSVLEGVEAPKKMAPVTLPNGQTVYQPQDVPETAEQKAERTAPASAVGDFFKNRYGGWQNIKDTLATDPVGAAADLASLLTLGSTAPVRGAGVLGKVASVVDPIMGPAKLVGKTVDKVVEPLVSNALGVTTGTGTAAIRTAAQAGREGGEVGDAFRNNMRGNVPMTDVVDMAESATDKMRQARGAEYREGMSGVNADKTVLDFAPIEDAVAKANTVGSYNGVVVNRSAGEAVQKINDLVNEWKAYPAEQFHTPEGLDALKRAVGDVRDSTEFGSPARVAADRVYNAIKEQISAQAPGYAKTMADYASASEQLKDVTKTFSLTDKSSADTSLRKLQSVMRNNVQTNYGERLKLADVLAAHEPTLPAAIAGQSMNSPTPRGLVARGAGLTGAGAAVHLMDPTLAATLPLTSPRIVGEGTYLAGRAAGGAEKLADALGATGPNIRAGTEGAFQGGRVREQEMIRELAKLLLRGNEQRQLRF